MKTVIAAALAALCALPLAASADDARVNELVLARRNVMAAVGRHMDEINAMMEPGRTLDAHEATEQADEIAVLLMAFAQLFPPGSNNWSKAREQSDPARVTRASPAVWSRAPDFRRQALAVSDLATSASRAPDEAGFRQRARALDAACMGCHQQFRREEKAYEIPIAPVH